MLMGSVEELTVPRAGHCLGSHLIVYLYATQLISSTRPHHLEASEPLSNRALNWDTDNIAGYSHMHHFSWKDP
jgi:hypothetical protein